MLAASWWEGSTDEERLQFWRAYTDERPRLDAPGEREAVEQLNELTQRYSCRVARRRDKRALRNNRDFLAVRRGRHEAHGVSDLPPEEMGLLVDDPAGPLRRNRHRAVKLGRSKQIVTAELPLTSGVAQVAYKQYRPRFRWKAFFGRFRRSRAIRGWLSGHALLARGIATPRPVAVCDVGRRWSWKESYLATEWVEGAEDLHHYGWRLAGLPHGSRLRRAARCADTLGRLIGRMHAWQITHGDLKAANLLLVEQEAGIEPYLIDVDGIHVARRLAFRHRVADLARLATSMEAHPWVSSTVLLRFFRAYVGQLPPDAADWKRLWRAVGRRSGRMIARKRRRGESVL
ncbi:MAG: lipopolysaccharide kinase InaA family protein [Planctomycetota bacterium]|jgi:tRNA A-37 threonylcarbamoyl transferase component Bud32